MPFPTAVLTEYSTTIISLTYLCLIFSPYILTEIFLPNPHTKLTYFPKNVRNTGWVSLLLFYPLHLYNLFWRIDSVSHIITVLAVSISIVTLGYSPQTSSVTLQLW